MKGSDRMDKQKISGRVFFACGASITANDISEETVGHRVVVVTLPHQGHQRPKLDGVEQHCCFRCPSTLKLSGRKFHRRVTYEDGSKGMVMLCKITEIIPDSVTCAKQNETEQQKEQGT